MTRPYAIVSDPHFHAWSAFSSVLPTGVNSRLQIIINCLHEAADNLLEQGGDTLYLAGDTFHVRGNLTPSVLNPVVDAFAEIIAKGIKVRLIPGNHDLESKDAKRLTNATQALERVGCTVVTEPTIFEDDKVVMIPWYDKQDDLIHNCADIRLDMDDFGDPAYAPQEEYELIIHAPLNGVIKGIPDNGIDPQDLEDLGYRSVFVGHYHAHRQASDNVYSVGALTHQTWGDVDTLAGHLLVRDGFPEHFESNAPRFIDFDLEWTRSEAAMECEGNYVRVKLDEVTEREIQEIREAVLNEYKASGVIIKSTPKITTTARTGSVTSKGVTLDQSISDWVKDNATVDKSDVEAECLDILKEVREVSEEVA